MDIDKIMNCTLEEYCKTTNSHAEEFDLVGVNRTGYTSPEGFKNILRDFSVIIPTEAAAVIRYTVIVTAGRNHIHYAASGTALIPKKEDESWTDNKGLSRKGQEEP